MVIDTFLYNDLRYKINLGKKPLLVGGVKVENYNSVPYIEWDVSFGLMDEDFKNYIEKLLIEEQSFDLKTKIHPYIELVYDDTTDLLSYIYPHEKKFYGTTKLDINRALAHTFIDPSITYDGQSYDKNSTVVLPTEIIIPHKVFFLDESLTVTHKTSGLFQVSAIFKEFFSPIDKTYSILGAVNVSNPGAI